MDRLPKNFNSIIRSCAILVDKGVRHICYEINEKEENSANFRVQLPEYQRPKKSDEIVDSNDNFVNGFKVVKTANGEYAYVRESDNSLLPFRYDIAFDFNEFGFAIVGKDGSVSWIDKDFKYLNLQGEMVEEELDKSWAKFDGWQGISAFSKGDIPLSRVYDGRNTYGRISYFGTDGKFKEFYKYNGEIDSYFPRTAFRNGSTFDEKGHAMADGNMIFAKGYYVSFKDLIKLSMEKGFIDSISADAEKCFDKETGRVLKKERKQRENYCYFFYSLVKYYQKLI